MSYVVHHFLFPISFTMCHTSTQDRSSKQFSCRHVNHRYHGDQNNCQTSVIVATYAAVGYCYVSRERDRTDSCLELSMDRGGELYFQAEIRVLPVQLKRSSHWNRGDFLCNQERVSERICLYSVNETKSDGQILVLTTSTISIQESEGGNHKITNFVI